MTSSHANLPSNRLGPSDNAQGVASGPLAGLMQALAATGKNESAGNGCRDFGSLLESGADTNTACAKRTTLETLAAQAAAAQSKRSAAEPESSLAFRQVDLTGTDEVFETEDVVPVVDIPDEPDVVIAEPLAAAVEMAASLVVAIAEALPAEEMTPVLEDGAGDAGSGETSVVVQLSNEPEFTVNLPRESASARTEALTSAIARLQDRSSSKTAIPNAATPARPEAQQNRAIETLTALASGLNPGGNRGTQETATGDNPVSTVINAVEAEIESSDGRKIRIAFNPAGRADLGEKSATTLPRADFAPDSAALREALELSHGEVKKTFLSAVDKELTNGSIRAGIGAAKSVDVMSDHAKSPIPTAESPSKAFEVVSGFAMGKGADILPAEFEQAANLQTGARRAVDTAVNVMELQASQQGREHSTVSVRMRVGDEDLSIRVQLLNGEVRTSFKTASPELSAAIAHEWQSAAAESPQRLLRFHEPQFENVERHVADRGVSDQSGQNGHSAREQASARRELNQSLSFASRRAAAPAITASPVLETAGAGSLRLSTFA